MAVPAEKTKQSGIRQIIMDSREVCSLITNKRSQFRRVMDPQPVFETRYVAETEHYALGHWTPEGRNLTFAAYRLDHAMDKCPLGRVGDYLYVRESFAVTRPDKFETWKQLDDPAHQLAKYIRYKADWKRPTPGLKWLDPMKMPRWASRFVLKITDTRCERLHDLSDEDAQAESMVGMRSVQTGKIHGLVDQFEQYWRSKHKGEHGWDENVWVWVVEFDLVTA